MIHRPLEEDVLTLQTGVEPNLFGYYSRCSTTQLQETCRGTEATKLLQIHVTDISCILQGLIVIVVYSSESSFLAKSPFIFIKIRL